MLVGLGLAACGKSEAVLRYRLTLTMEVYGEPISASAVQEIRATWQEPLFYFPNQTHFFLRQRGQAIDLTLPDGKLVVVSMTTSGRDASDSLLRTCDLLKTDIPGEEVVTQIGAFRGTCDIPPNRMPTMFRADSTETPIPATRIDPDNPAATLGFGVRRLSMQLSTTTDPLIFDLPERQPWVDEPTSYGRPLAIVPMPQDGTEAHIVRYTLIKESF